MSNLTNKQLKNLFIKLSDQNENRSIFGDTSFDLVKIELDKRGL